MTKFTITVIDTTGIQGYVFSSNRLRENIGASHLVSEATIGWVKETLVNKLEIQKSRQEEPIETSGLNAELVYAGGGNTLLIFKSRKIAIEFTQTLSTRVLKEAPGLNLVVAHADFDWNSDHLYSVVENLIKVEIERRKHERVPSVPLLGLGVTALCNSTQLPAVGRSNKDIKYDDEAADSYFISNETKQKINAASSANKQLQKIFTEVVDLKTYQFPYRTDHLGRSEDESSYVAIVHADANGMGKRFQVYGKKAENNRDYINRIRELSKTVEKAGQKALKTIAKTLTQSIKEGKFVGTYGEFELKADYLPFRPLVYGGDDITFICEGRLGLELATLFLREFEEQHVADGEKLTACAGVCVVKTHYPFSRAYEISEALCREGKRFVKGKKEFEPDGFSVIDWHLAASGLVGSISEIRKREYQLMTNDNTWHLAMRPVRIKNKNGEWRTWQGFTQVIREFKEGKDWKERHNKIMALREVLRNGSSEAIKEFLLAYKLPQLPSFPESNTQTEELAREGWLNRYCGYFDAIEAIDFYIGLED